MRRVNLYELMRRSNLYELMRRVNLYELMRRSNLYELMRRVNLYELMRWFNLYELMRWSNLYELMRRVNLYELMRQVAGPSGRAVGVGLRPLACWDRGFESHWGHGCLSVVIVVCCQVEVFLKDWSLVQESPTDCGASLCVIKKPSTREGYSPLQGYKIQTHNGL